LLLFFRKEDLSVFDCHAGVKSPLAVVTMVYNEPDFLPVWARHYRTVLGAEHCYVIDHGSDDESIAASCPLQVARLPRSPLDEHWRADLVSTLCARLLERYEVVAYTDVDELLVADPRRFNDLVGLAAATEADVLTAFGSNILEVPGDAPIDLDRPISAQRHWARPYSSLCKPVFIRRPVRWGPGFHYADAASHFGGLYLFHIAYADNAITARRQAKRCGVERADGHGAHHGTPPEEMVRLMKACAALPRDPDAKLGGAAESRFVAALLRDGRAGHGGRMIAADREPPVLWALPRWLEGCF
jgi:hypothetical protein